MGGLGVALTVLLGLDAALALLAAGFLTWRRSLLGKLLDGTVVDPNQLYDADKAARASLGWFIIFTVATIVVFICWFWAARNNAEAYAPNRGTLGVGWSVGAWFVPVACLVLPCIVARDIYRGTMAGRQGKRAGGGQITGWWWTAFVALWVMALVVSGENGAAKKATDPVEHVRDVQSAVTAGIVAMAVGAVTALLAIAYVNIVTKTQNARNREGAWYGGPGAAQQGPYGMAYGYGAPMAGGYPMPMPGYPADQPPTPGYQPDQPPMPGYQPDQPPMPGYQPDQPPTPGYPVQDRIPADPGIAETQTAETQTAEVQNTEPPSEPGGWPTPPS